MKKIFITALVCLFSVIISAQSYKGYVLKKTPEEKMNELYCTGLFRSTHGTILEVASNASSLGYINILNWLQGRVAGLQVYTSGSGTILPVIRGSVASVYIDEFPVPASFLNFLNVNDIAIVKIIKTPFLGGFNNSGGAVAIYTLGTDDEEEVNNIK